MDDSVEMRLGEQYRNELDMAKRVLKYAGVVTSDKDSEVIVAGQILLWINMMSTESVREQSESLVTTKSVINGSLMSTRSLVNTTDSEEAMNLSRPSGLIGSDDTDEGEDIVEMQEESTNSVASVTSSKSALQQGYVRQSVKLLAKKARDIATTPKPLRWRSRTRGEITPDMLRMNMDNEDVANTVHKKRVLAVSKCSQAPASQSTTSSLTKGRILDNGMAKIPVQGCNIDFNISRLAVHPNEKCKACRGQGIISRCFYDPKKKDLLYCENSSMWSYHTWKPVFCTWWPHKATYEKQLTVVDLQTPQEGDDFVLVRLKDGVDGVALRVMFPRKETKLVDFVKTCVFYWQAKFAQMRDEDPDMYEEYTERCPWLKRIQFMEIRTDASHDSNMDIIDKLVLQVTDDSTRICHFDQRRLKTAVGDMFEPSQELVLRPTLKFEDLPTK